MSKFLSDLWYMEQLGTIHGRELSTVQDCSPQNVTARPLRSLGEIRSFFPHFCVLKILLPRLSWAKHIKRKFTLSVGHRTKRTVSVIINAVSLREL